jgi:hypothetical protein
MNRRSFSRGILAGIASVFGLVRPSKGQQPTGSSHVVNIDGDVVPITNGPTFRDCEVTFRISLGAKCEGFPAWEKVANRIPSTNRAFSKVYHPMLAERGIDRLLFIERSAIIKDDADNWTVTIKGVRTLRKSKS